MAFAAFRRKLARPSGAALGPVTVPQPPFDHPADAWRVPVLVVRYIPVRGDEVDRDATGDVGGSLSGLRGHIAGATSEVVRVLETGSMYHGYRDPAARPSLRYEIVGEIEFVE